MTECPKCGAAVAESPECPSCGLVFAKYERRVSTLAAAALPPPVAIRNLEDEATSGIVRWASAALLAGLAVWTWSFAKTPLSADAMDSFLHLPDLVFHEAGHVIFSPLGQFMTALGGSLMQVLVPVTLAGAFVRQHQPFSAAVCAWWAGQNLVDLAPYIADARALRLVLLGGKTGAEVEGHDWEFILTQLGAVHHDRTLGLAAYSAGLTLMIAAIAFGAWTLYRAKPSVSELPSAS